MRGIIVSRSSSTCSVVSRLSGCVYFYVTVGIITTKVVIIEVSCRMKSAMLWLPLLVVTLMSLSVRSDTLDDKTDVAKATTAFTLNVMKSVLKSEQGNVIMSPLSVSTLLAMLQQGAKNNSVTQLTAVLNLIPEASKNFGTVIQNFSKSKFKSKLEFNNKIFVHPDFDLLAKFSSVLHTNFHTAAENLDFHNPTAAAERINNWVKYSSKNRILELVKAESISGRTQMILANVIYFKGHWLKTFAPEDTVTEEFQTSAKSTIQVPMMNIHSLFRSGEDNKLGAVWVELPFDSDAFTMVLVLPKTKHQLSKVIEKLTLTDFNNMLNTRITKEVKIKLPRFKLDGEVQFVPALQKLGLVDVFDQRSNLEGISTTKSPLVVSDIIHKAEIEVNEEGSEASAGTGIYVNTLSLQPDYDRVDFLAKEPFLVFIVDKVNNMPLFAGRVSNPSSK